MKRIKITAYIDFDSLPDGWADPSHEMGVSEEGYMGLPGKMPLLDDITLEVVDSE